MLKTDELRRGYFNHFGVNINEGGQVEATLQWWRDTHHIHGFVGVGTSGKYYYEIWKWKGGSLGWEQLARGTNSGVYEEEKQELLLQLLEIYKSIKDV